MIYYVSFFHIDYDGEQKTQTFSTKGAAQREARRIARAAGTHTVQIRVVA